MLEILSSHFRFNTYGLLNVGTAFADITLGILVFINNPRSSKNKSFLLIAFTIFVWLTGFGVMSLARTKTQARFWMSLSFFGGVPFTSPAFYWFSQTLNNPHARFPKGVFAAAALIAVPMVFFSQAVFTVSTFPWGRYNGVGSSFSFLYLSLLLLFFGYWAIAAFINVSAGWRSATDPFDKKQRQNIALAFIIGYTAATDFLVTLGKTSYPFGYVAVSILLTIVAYTIVRHRFLDINIVIRRFVLCAIIYALLLLVAAPFVYVGIKIVVPLTSIYVGTVTVGTFLGLVISSGPLIYAYLLRHNFWLKTQLSMGLAHELKSPLSAITGAADIALDRIEANSSDVETLRRYFEMIRGNAVRLDSFVGNLLTVAKGSDDTLDVDRKIIDFGDVITSQLGVHQSAADRRGIRLETHRDGPLALSADREKVELVLSNLLSNAIKYSNGGTVRVRTSIKRRMLYCAVSDEGVGIAKADLDRVFDRFYQGENARSGAGLGLTIAKNWIEAHGGRIWAESAGLGKGTTVTFTLPAEKQA